MKNRIKLASQVLRRNRTEWLWLIPMLFLQGCATIYKPQNESITTIDNTKGYRLVDSHSGDYGDHLIFLAFSGGGTRAAALSYGVLQELRDMQIDARSHRVRLLDEVDSITRYRVAALPPPTMACLATKPLAITRRYSCGRALKAH